MCKKTLVDWNFALDLTAAKISNSTLEIRKQWNAGLCERIFNLAKKHLHERLLSDSLSLVGENTEMSNSARTTAIRH